MIKEFKNISLEDLTIFYEHGFSIYEKLDMYYFRVEITKVGAIATKSSTENVISDIDCITNTMFKDICNFVDATINPIRNDIITEFGEIRVGFFYNPKQRYHVIDYTKNKELSECFIVSDVYSYSNKFVSTSKLVTYFKLYNNINCIYDKPILTVNPPEYITWEDKNAIKNYLDGNSTPNELVKYLIGDNTFSELSHDEIEGIIIRCDDLVYQNVVYQIIINNTDKQEIDKNTKLIYRDTILQSFVNVLGNQEILSNTTVDDIIKDAKTYIDKISNLFLFYIENTALFSKYSIDPEDLLPPHIGYMGDVDLDIIPNQNVKILCMHNEVNKNIFRLLLHTFSRNISANKFSSFSENDQAFLRDLTIKLQYKNYKQIMYTAYKASKNYGK